MTILLSGFFASPAQSPNGNEWFRQKKTQRKYLIQQIAALKVYLGYLEEGYDIAKKGLNIIGNIKDRNFSDHSTYFESLRLVNSSVKSSGKIANIIAYQNQIMNEFRKLRNDPESNETLTQQEIGHIKEVHDNLMTECESSITLLTQVISNHTVEMKDDERLAAIDLLYEDMKDKYTFTRSFVNSTQMLMMQRSHEQFEILESNELYQSP